MRIGGGFDIEALSAGHSRGSANFVATNGLTEGVSSLSNEDVRLCLSA